MHSNAFNKYFLRTLLHEFAHALNAQWNVRRLNPTLDNARDEQLAEEWITWLGVTFPTDSSEENLSMVYGSSAGVASQR